MREALITGNLGFVGRHFERALKQQGWHVIGVDIAAPHRPSIEETGQDCRTGFRRGWWKGIDLVIHCAATIPPIDQRAANDLIVANDLSIDSAMFQWALRARPRQIVYFSSAAAYPIELQQGPYAGTLLSEDHIDLDDLNTPDRMYGFTKLAGELQAREARRQGLDVRVFRPFSGYGADQSLDYPFPSFIDRSRQRQSPFDVWGSGDQVRDFVHVDDIVDVVTYTLPLPNPGPLNIGTGIPTSMREFARLCHKAVGYSPPLRVHGDKPQGAYYRCADTTKLDSIRKPGVSLQSGIHQALIWKENCERLARQLDHRGHPDLPGTLG